MRGRIWGKGRMELKEFWIQAEGNQIRQLRGDTREKKWCGEARGSCPWSGLPLQGLDLREGMLPLDLSWLLGFLPPSFRILNQWTSSSQPHIRISRENLGLGWRLTIIIFWRWEVGSREREATSNLLHWLVEKYLPPWISVAWRNPPLNEEFHQLLINMQIYANNMQLLLCLWRQVFFQQDYFTGPIQLGRKSPL